MSSIRLQSAKQTDSVSQKGSHISTINKSISKTAGESVKKTKSDPTKHDSSKSGQNMSISKHGASKSLRNNSISKHKQKEDKEKPLLHQRSKLEIILAIAVLLCLILACVFLALHLTKKSEPAKLNVDNGTAIGIGGVEICVTPSCTAVVDVEDENPGDTRTEKQAKLWYKSCMDVETIEKLKSKPLLDIYQLLGGWPLLQKGWNDKMTLTELLIKMKTILNQDIFFMFNTDVSKNGTTFWLLKEDTTIRPRMMLNQTAIAIYKKVVVDFINAIASGIGLNLSSVILNNDVEKMVFFELYLVNISSYDTPNKNVKWSVNTLVQNVKSIEMAKLLEGIIPKDVHEKLFVKDPIVITVYNTDQLQRLDNFLPMVKEDVFNYAMWKCAINLYNYLDAERYYDIIKPYTNMINVSTGHPIRWRFCLGNVLNLDKVFSATYVKKYFHKDDKAEATKMVANLKETFASILKNADWMDEVTKNAAMEKLNAMVVHIGYSNFVTDDAKVDSYYSELNFTHGMTFFNILTQGWVWTFRHSMRNLINPVDTDRDLVAAYTVNAFYEPEFNYMFIPAGILQSPFFQRDFPKAINYGGIGAVMGHEITHGFDNRGSVYDKNGNLFDWWSNSSKTNFINKNRCMAKQYANYAIPGFKENINGLETLGENIADNGGLKESLAAYKKFLKDLGKPEPKLPGLDASNEQLFFLSYGLLRCTKQTREATIESLKNPHAPDYVRLNVPLSNMAEFSSAFQCKPGTKMNPDHKCTVW